MRILLTSTLRQDCRIGCSAYVQLNCIQKRLNWRLITDREHLIHCSVATKQGRLDPEPTTLPVNFRQRTRTRLCKIDRTIRCVLLDSTHGGPRSQAKSVRTEE